MSATLEALQSLSITGEYLFYGSPLSVDELDNVEMPDGRLIKAIRPAMPRNFNRKLGVFEPHSEFPVVCATRFLPVSSLHRALCHSANHQRVPEDRRGHGIDAIGNLVVTKELFDDIRSSNFTSHVHVLRFQAPPFEQFLEEADEWRSPVAAEIERSYEVTGADLTYPVLVRERSS